MHKLSKIVLSGKSTYGSRETELLAKGAQDKCIESQGCAYKTMAIFKTRNKESRNGNGERGTGNLSNGESLKAGIFKTGNL